MKAILDEKGFIISYALVGDLVDGIELPDPDDLSHFEEHFSAYKVRDSTATFDNEHSEALLTEAKKDEFRMRREKECFSVINRGWLWYDTLTEKQTKELRKWYKDWLDVTETKKKPDRPSWLK